MTSYPFPWKVTVARYGKKKRVFIVGPSPRTAGLCITSKDHAGHDCQLPEDVAEIGPSMPWMSHKMKVATAHAIVNAQAELPLYKEYHAAMEAALDESPRTKKGHAAKVRLIKANLAISEYLARPKRGGA